MDVSTGFMLKSEDSMPLLIFGLFVGFYHPYVNSSCMYALTRNTCDINPAHARSSAYSGVLVRVSIYISLVCNAATPML